MRPPDEFAGSESVSGRHFAISREVFLLAPKYCRHVLLATGSGPRETPPELVERFRVAVRGLQSRSSLETLTDSPAVAPWRAVFRAAGWSPSKFRSSIEALQRRALRSELEPLNIALVDCGTIATLEHDVPIGVHILDDLPSFAELSLAPSSGQERFQLFDGTVENPDPGEIVYKCGDVVLTRRWVWRQGKVGSVAGDPRALAVNIDLINSGGVAEDEIVSSVRALLLACGYSVVRQVVLDNDHPTDS